VQPFWTVGAIRGVSVMLAAAAVSATAALAAPAPKAAVIRLHDLPSGFQTVAAHAYTVTAAAKRNQQSVAQLRSWGFVTAYEADYVRNVALKASLKGAFEVQSAISVYKASKGAKLSLARSSAACKRAPSIELRTSAKIGDEVHVCKNLARSNGVVLQAYAVLWRRGSRRGSLFMVGVQGGVTVGQAITLAKKQDARMR
jgi:hypothetical protein